MEHSILIHMRLHADEPLHTDAWTHAAVSSTSIDPLHFIQAEATAITRLMEDGRYDHALQRVRRCFDILSDYRDDMDDAQNMTPAEQNLWVLEAQILMSKGQPLLAIEKGKELLAKLGSAASHALLVRIYAYFILWHHELGQDDEVFNWSNKLESLFPAKKASHLV